MGIDLNDYVERKLKNELRISAIGAIVFLLFSIVSLIKGEVWWVPGGFFVLFIYCLYETIKTKKKLDDYKSNKLEY